MALTRFLPTPSDRMGILWSLLQMEDAIILEYGTEGTTAYAMKINMMMGMNVQNKLFVTGLDENNVVMGDTTNLEKKILELDKKFSPKAIFVMASSVSSMTGTDVKGVCKYMQEEVNAKLVVFSQGGFNGDYSSGLQASYTDLISNFAISRMKKENCYNILGVFAMDKSANADVLEIEKQLSNNFGLHKNAVLSLETNLEKIETMSKALVNIVLSYEGLKAAEILKERFDIPYIYGQPIGITATNKWLIDIAKAINMDFEITKTEQSKQLNRKVLIYASYDKALALKQYMEEKGCTVLDVVCTHKIKKQDSIRYIKNEKEKIDLFKLTKDSIVFGDDTFLKFADNSNVKIRLTQSESLFDLQYLTKIFKY
ncbi:nitrogenase component 1 [Tannockella kyphosi]|uniref:nitrogenase component 1 n=1 Tax=Tannockella kyphosi TaxID=2899121 RepID=UPI002012AB98|nr:nitrogenase component 1 [Tannockella kyphosi]